MAALHPVVGVSVQILNIHNVDLFFQGLYHVRVRLREDKEEPHLYAVPHIFRLQGEDGHPNARHSRLPPAAVVDIGDGVPAFRSRSALVRYCDEDIVLDDAAEFRLELVGDADTALLLEADLMFADVTHFGGVDCFDPDNPQPPPSPLPSSRDLDILAEFQQVSTQRVRIHGAETGIHAYSPVVFDELHFCQVGIIVHAAVLDYRLRMTLGSDGLYSSNPAQWNPAKAAHPDDTGGTNMLADPATPLRSRPASISIRKEKVLGPPLTTALVQLAARSCLDDSFAPQGMVSNESRVQNAVNKLRAEYTRRLVSSHGGLTEFLKAATKTWRKHQPPDSEWASAQGPTLAWMRPTPIQTADGAKSSGSLSARTTGSVQIGRTDGTRPSGADLSVSTVGGALARGLVQTLSGLSAQLLAVWQLLLTATVYASSEVAALLRAEWQDISTKHWSESMFRSVHAGSELAVPSDREIWKFHGSIADALRRSEQYRQLRPMQLQDISTTLPPEVHPVVFLQRFSTSLSPSVPDAAGAAVVVIVIDSGGRSCEVVAARNWTGQVLKLAVEWALQVPMAEQLLLVDGKALAEDQRVDDVAKVDDGSTPVQMVLERVVPIEAQTDNQTLGSHVVVLVHGFQGNSYDMRLLKDNIAILHPNSLYLCSTANEEDTEGDIGQMGQRLADEVKTFVKEWCTSPVGSGTLQRLSFVAHSMGGLITRAALPHLQEEFGDKFHSYVSLSTPHLGYLYASNSLFKTGLWVAKKIRRSICLEQVSLTDQVDPRQCYMFELAKTPGLQYFSHVVLVSSYQDNYAPFESARIEEACVAEADAKLGHVYAEMVRNLLAPLKPERVIRLDVNFHIPETNFDTVIGRAAHIQLIENQTLMQMVAHTHKFLFE